MTQEGRKCRGTNARDKRPEEIKEVRQGEIKKGAGGKEKSVLVRWPKVRLSEVYMKKEIKQTQPSLLCEK